MGKLLLALSAVVTLGWAGFGCAHDIDQARADYHHDKAQRAADRGHYYKAAKEERKADIDQRKASEDVF